jgi:ERCC4-type nuclease
VILVDPRRGSGELLDAIKSKTDATIETLPAGDFAFEGNGPDGRVMVGIERKRLSDALKSITDGRFAGYQLIEMANLYQFIFLVIEGMYRPDRNTGLLEEYRGGQWVPAGHGSRRFMWKDLDHFLMTLQIKTSVKVFRAVTPNETVQVISDLYSWFNDKHWKEHKSHLALHSNPRPVTFRKPPLRRIVANELPHIGWEKSKLVADRFPNTGLMMQATEQEWQEIDGIGPKIASDIVRTIWSE